ncbi:hypothetical protein LWI29_022940 [Acer saccharum]|uniref:Uncharacterized protein n=1 Tax=Acer saccharum TaxID=4024 RepID=A0AA39SZ45_ACESA|nr:hypothetical protein LWI29_022940 [Acer saccharum]
MKVDGGLKVSKGFNDPNDRPSVVDRTDFTQVIDDGPDFIVKDKAGTVTGLKAGKWNRWARDGIRQDYGLEAEVYLGKRCLNDDGANGDKRLKLAHSGEILLEDSTYGEPL